MIFSFYLKKRICYFNAHGIMEKGKTFGTPRSWRHSEKREHRCLMGKQKCITIGSMGHMTHIHKFRDLYTKEKN